MKRKPDKESDFLFVCGCREKFRQFFILNKGAINEKLQSVLSAVNGRENSIKIKKRGGQMEDKRLKQFTFYDLYYEALKGLPDEAAGSLDVENETIIQTALSRLIKDKTVLIIAHRMRTVAGADKIVVLADGVVAEQGKPSELYNKNGIYARMVDLQSASGQWKIK